MGNFLRKKSNAILNRTVFPCTYPRELSDDPNAKFANNYLRTTKYTILTFLPLNIWEQLHRIANCYFIFIVILNFMPNVEAFAKELSIMPVVAVLALTAIKDGCEDLKRFRADQRVNNAPASVFSLEDRCYANRRLADIRPGDFVKLRANEVIPADILLLKSSELSGMCLIETANLDGETNLKYRECVRTLQNQTFAPEEFLWPAEVEAPNAELYHFNGRIHAPTPITVRKDNLLLRGCILRNTASAEGMVIYAGRETKAALNNSSRKFKRSKLEGRLNKDIIWCIPILVILCIIGSVGAYVWLNSLPNTDTLFLQTQETKNSALSAFINFWVFVITFQAMIPLPLYITIEGVKVLQVFFMHHDLGLYDAKRDRSMEVHAFNIPEDLGQIEYVLCDKTGTLTENKMIFRRAVINGVDYCVDEDLPFELVDENGSPETARAPNKSLSAVRDFIPFAAPSSSCVQMSCDRLSSHSSHSSMSLLGEENRTFDLPPPSSSSSANGDNNDELESRNCRRVQDFFLCLTICNTCVVSANKNTSVPLVPVPKRKPFSLRLRDIKLNTSFDGSRFRRFFIRRSRGEVFEVGEESVTASQKITSGNTLSIDAELIDSQGLEDRQSRRSQSGSWSWEADSGDRQSLQPLKRLLTPLIESPQLGESKSNQPTDSHFTFEEELQLKPARQHLFHSKSKPKIARQFKGQNPHHSSVVPSDCSDWSALSQASSSTRWRSDDISLINRPSSHVCPLSENTLINGYESESPDEVTLVKTACKYGCKLLQRGVNFVIIWLPGDGLIRVEVLMLLPFDAKRKRMSIIIRHPDTEEIVLYCKGADSAILPLLDPCIGQSFKDGTERHLKEYSSSGLRTLVMAKRVLSEFDYQKWSAAWSMAEQDYQHSEELKYKLMEDIEVNLELLGATGIEDSLQKGVPETIAALRESGMKVWVLTGDKQETAVSIAYAAKLITQRQKVFILSANSVEETKRQLKSFIVDILPLPSRAESASSYLASSTVSRIQQSPLPTGKKFRIITSGKEVEAQEEPVHCLSLSAFSVLDNEVTADIPQEGFALVLDSTCLPFLQEEEVKELFIKLARICFSVICCRFTPSQKAAVTELVKSELRVRTMAVGDGANDVSMIQSADVGVGISGQEGLQAAMASDFVITQFVFLKRLLLVHGHRCYDKLARMALYMFYKDAVYIFSLFWYQFFNGFSGSAHINQLTQVLFNLLYTSLPPFVLGAFDNVLDDETLMANPKLYRHGRDSMTYKPWHFWLNTLDAMWQSMVIFFLPYFAFADSTICMDELGTTCMNSLVFTSLAHIALETKYFTIIHAITYIGSYLILWLLFTIVYNAVPGFRVGSDAPYFVIFVLMCDPRFWLCMLIVPVTALLPRLLLNSTLNTFAPNLQTLAAQLRRKHGFGVSLPIGCYVEEHDACQRRHGLGRRQGRLVTGEPRNIRSSITKWFTSAGRLLQRSVTLRQHMVKPSVLLIRDVSFAWPHHSSAPQSVANIGCRTNSLPFASPHLHKANSYSGMTANEVNREVSFVTRISGGDTFTHSELAFPKARQIRARKRGKTHF